jgi:hypothetical protein
MFNKILLAAIATGLCANVVATVVVRPAHADAPAYADTELKLLTSMATNVDNIRRDLYNISMSTCPNKKLC